MSSYLNFYVTPKTENNTKQHLMLLTYSRNNMIYNYFKYNLDIPWAGDEEKYLLLDEKCISIVLTNINDDINKVEKRLAEYEKHSSSEIIENIIEMKEDLEDLKECRSNIYFIMDLLITNDIIKNFEEISCNIS